jgi:general secretion pathway protein A
MYKEFFGLRENPFNVNPDPRYLFLTSQTRAALDELTYGIQARKGLLLLTGEVGTGKTTLINKLLEHLHQRKTPTAFVFNSHLEANHLFDFILADFGLPVDWTHKDSSLMRLNHWLIEHYRAGGETPVLIVDEAQGLPLHVLEEIRMLLNLETPHEKLLQIVLVGQPELEERLRRPDLRQLKQRITLRCKTTALTLEETYEYVHSRLSTAGADGGKIFSREAVDALHLYSGGIPRVVNLLCEHGLINAYADNVKPVQASTIREIAREFQFDDVEPLGGPVVSADALTNKLIAMQSTLASALSQRPVAASQIRQEEAFGAVSIDSDSVEIAAAAQNNAYDLLEPIRSAGRSGTEVHESSASVIFSCDAGVNYVAELAGERATLAPLPRLHVVESRDKHGDLPATPAHGVPASENRAALHAKVDAGSNAIRTGWRNLHASIGLLFRRLAKRRSRVLSAVSSPDWSAITETSRLRLKRAVHSTRAWYHESLRWLNKRPVNHGSTNATRRNAPVYRWLHEPWAPQMLFLANSRLFELRRKLTQRKT